MKVIAQVVGVENVSGNSKKDGKAFSFNVVKFLDMEAKSKELLSAMVPDGLLNDIHSVNGKTIALAFSFVRERFTLDAIAKAA